MLGDAVLGDAVLGDVVLGDAVLHDGVGEPRLLLELPPEVWWPQFSTSASLVQWQGLLCQPALKGFPLPSPATPQEYVPEKQVARISMFRTVSMAEGYVRVLPQTG
jgi:hypothetical protein